MERTSDVRLRDAIGLRLLLIALLALPALTAVAQRPDQPGGGPPQFGAPGQGQPRFGPGRPMQMPFPGMGMGIPGQMPEMAKKMAAIIALRHINAIGLTPKDIEESLPVLKAIRDGEKALQTRTEKMLEEEKRALLAARPGTEQPMGTGEQMQQAAQQFAMQQEKGWVGLRAAS